MTPFCLQLTVISEPDKTKNIKLFSWILAQTFASLMIIFFKNNFQISVSLATAYTYSKVNGELYSCIDVISATVFDSFCKLHWNLTNYFDYFLCFRSSTLAVALNLHVMLWGAAAHVRYNMQLKHLHIVYFIISFMHKRYVWRCRALNASLQAPPSPVAWRLSIRDSSCRPKRDQISSAQSERGDGFLCCPQASDTCLQLLSSSRHVFTTSRLLYEWHVWVRWREQRAAPRPSVFAAVM